MHDSVFRPAAWCGSPVTRRAFGRWLCTGSLLVALGFGPPVAAARRRLPPAAGGAVTGHSPWRELGDTPAATFRAEFDRLGSPMRREADAIRDELAGFSRLYLAMAFMETKYATYQEIIPPSYHNALAVKAGDGSGAWDRYPSFQDGARTWVRRLADPRGPYAGADTLRDLIAIYAPRFDNNKVTRYVATVVDQIGRFPLEPEPEPEPDRKPRPERDPDPAPRRPAAAASVRAADAGDGRPAKKPRSRGEKIARRNRLRLAEQRPAAAEAGDRLPVEDDA